MRSQIQNSRSTRKKILVRVVAFSVVVFLSRNNEACLEHISAMFTLRVLENACDSRPCNGGVRILRSLFKAMLEMSKTVTCCDTSRVLVAGHHVECRYWALESQTSLVHAESKCAHTRTHQVFDDSLMGSKTHIIIHHFWGAFGQQNPCCWFIAFFT